MMFQVSRIAWLSDFGHRMKRKSIAEQLKVKSRKEEINRGKHSCSERSFSLNFISENYFMLCLLLTEQHRNKTLAISEEIIYFKVVLKSQMPLFCYSVV